MSLTVAQFAQQAEQITRRLRPAHQASLKRLVVYAGEQLIDASPVLTGQYRRSHRAAVNGFDLSYHLPRPKEHVDPILPADHGFMKESASTAKAGDRVNFSNSVPHALIVEEGGGNTPCYASYMIASIRTENESVREAVSVADRVFQGVA